MILSDLSIRKPVLATVMSLVLVVFGWVGYTRLPVRELPDVDFPIVTVTTMLPGANPEIVEEEVTDVIEEEINTVEGIKHITSVSGEGTSTITVEFDLDRDIDVAAQDIRDKVSRIRQELPDDIEEPAIEKLDMDAMAIMWLALKGKDFPQSEITYYADKVLKEQLQRVKGVGSILLGGDKRFAVRIWLDAEKLAARKLTVNDVIRALQEKNVELPSGRVEGLNREFTVKTDGELQTVEEFNDVVIAYQNGTPTRLRDIGRAVEGVENERNLARFNSEPTTGLGILKQSEANTLEVAEGVKRKMEELKKDLPPGMELWIAYDSSEFVQKSIDEVKETLMFSGFLVLVIIFVFLRNLRSTFVPGAAMFISIISTYAVMYFMGFTLNNFTMLALVLSIGVVVDDAIVMLENIYRHMEEGSPAMEAASIGSREVAFPVIAASLSLAAVFLPVAFMEGQIGRFFYEFGLTISAAVLVSAFVALTLTPMMCSRILRVSKNHGALYNRFEAGYVWLEERYRSAIGWALSRRRVIMGGAFLSFLLSIFLFGLVGKEFVPTEDRGNYMIIVDGPEGSTIEYSDKYLKEIEKIVHETPGTYSFFSALALGGSTAVNSGILFIRMNDIKDRPHINQILPGLRGRLFAVTGVNAFASGQQNKQFEYILQNPDFHQLQKYTDLFVQRLVKTKGFIEVDSDLEVNKPEIRISIDRDRAADLGVSIRDIADTLNTLLGGNDYTKFKARGERYDVILQLERSDRLTPEVIETIYIRASDGRLIDLSSVIKMEEGVGPSAINRYDRERSVKISANLDGITLEEAVQQADRIASEILPPGFTKALTGQAEEMAESFASLLLTFFLAILMIYLILSAQFESFLHPVTIMAALPLSAIGAVGFLWLSGMTLNMYSLIGMVMLMGLVTKNSILLVEYTNVLREKGMKRDAALAEAGRIRLRPILMTAASTIIGILPIAMRLGAGAESRRPMGMAIVGGMLTSTFLTLFVVPVLYGILEDLAGKLRRRPRTASENG